MKKLILMVAAIVIWSAAGTANAADTRTYVAVNLGIAIDSDSTLSNKDFSGTLSTYPGYAVTGAVGLDFGVERVEAEIGYRTTDIDTISSQGTSLRVDGTIQLVSYMLNGYLTVPGRSSVKPFITAGIGAATAYWSDQKFQGQLLNQAASNTQLAYQAGIGVSYDATANVSIDGSYRYFGTTDFDIAGLKAGYGSHTALVAIRYRF